MHRWMCPAAEVHSQTLLQLGKRMVANKDECKQDGRKEQIMEIMLKIIIVHGCRDDCNSFLTTKKMVVHPTIRNSRDGGALYSSLI